MRGRAEREGGLPEGRVLAKAQLERGRRAVRAAGRVPRVVGGRGVPLLLRGVGALHGVRDGRRGGSGGGRGGGVGVGVGRSGCSVRGGARVRILSHPSLHRLLLLHGPSVPHAAPAAAARAAPPGASPAALLLLWLLLLLRLLWRWLRGLLEQQRRLGGWHERGGRVAAPRASGLVRHAVDRLVRLAHVRNRLVDVLRL